MHRLLLPALFLICITQSGAVFGETLYIYIGAPSSENADVQQASDLLIHSPALAKKSLLALIDREPHHQLARALLAKCLLKEGDAPAALSQVSKFLEHGNTSLQSLGVATDIATALGDKKLTLELLRRRNARAVQLFGADVANGPLTDAALAELLGRDDEAAKLLTPQIDDRTPTRVCKNLALGNLRMRQGAYEQAQEAFSAALNEAQQSMPEWCPILRLMNTKALWAMGKREDALAAATDAYSKMMAKGDTNPEHLADAVSMIAVLSAAHASHRDPAWQESRALMQGFHRKYEFAEKNSLLMQTAFALCSGDSRGLAGAIQYRLRKSPNWDEGLWCALYAGIVFPELGTSLHTLLPLESVQQRLLAATH